MSIDDYKVFLWDKAKFLGTNQPVREIVDGREAIRFAGGPGGTSYISLPEEIFENISDETGFTVSTWIYGEHPVNVWERLIDFGKSQNGPYFFVTRNLRVACFDTSENGEIAVDPGRGLKENEWTFVTISVSGTKNGTASSAGPRVYVNGELWADGHISQTSSGNYKAYRNWWKEITEAGALSNSYIGRSQFNVDPDFVGALSDFNIYNKALDGNEILELMCQSLNDEQIVDMAVEKFMPKLPKIIVKDLELPDSLLDKRVSVNWKSKPADYVSVTGKVKKVDEPVAVSLIAEISCKDIKREMVYNFTLMPVDMAPYELTINSSKEVLDISKTLYGLFFEDINHSADGGIYAEMVQNRSFEEFYFNTYDVSSGENGISTGRHNDPLKYWFGDLDKLQPLNEGGLNDNNINYIRVMEPATIYNRGFCDGRFHCSMNFKNKEHYYISFFAKAKEETKVVFDLCDAEGKSISDQAVEVAVDSTDWKKYELAPIMAKTKTMGQLKISFQGQIDVDMISMMPEFVWGYDDKGSKTSHANFAGNPNYRLRKDLVDTLYNMKPSFLRFPGGCISEGSYIWDNVYDWKDSVGPVEGRKENFNVWGYTMTLGLGYMEYFQLAEDLGAEPLPVMACGVLCQARSDYANPAGGALRQKYIENFTDLIDFALSEDFNNKWARLRKDMGHAAPFGLHYLGVGNENWGTEFMANFEEFYHEIDAYVKKNYPDQPFTIISTAGAQADDDAYQEGWKFLSGYHRGDQVIAFTDGKQSWEENVSWYKNHDNYLDTIVDEHYYRSNDYLLENADRYNYYYRPYDAEGQLIENQVSKVFVGEYASIDKNTLAGAVAEAAVMTGFENNSDVVRLAATAPLFNKVGGDGTYRWTPDAIWFDDQTVWKTPNYYVQQLFASYLGDKLVETSFSTYVKGEKQVQKPRGEAYLKLPDDIELIEVNVIDSQNQKLIPSKAEKTQEGIKLIFDKASEYTVSAIVRPKEDKAYFSIVAGKQDNSYHEFVVGHPSNGSGLKVVKDGREAYTMGDYSSSVYAGNLRKCFDQTMMAGTIYEAKLDFGGPEGKTISISCADQDRNTIVDMSFKLAYYNRDIYSSVTKNSKHIYAKLVNADNYDKKVKINFADCQVKPKEWIVLAANDEQDIHMPNVNKSMDERVKPKIKGFEMSNNMAEFDLQANSVNIIVVEYK